MVSVVIPSLCGNDALVELVAHVRRGMLEAEVIVVDNGLSRWTVDRVRAEGGNLIRMDVNVGFAAAVNAGAMRADGEVLVVINDDVTPLPGFLDALVAPVRSGATMAAGVLLDATRRNTIETAGLEIDRTIGAHDYLRGEPVAILDRELPPPLAPCGGAAAYSRDAFRAVGGFDEGFFAYFEDLDLALRLRAEGASCALASQARALHTGSATLGARSVEKAVLVGFSRGYLMRKYGVLSTPLSAVLAVAQESAASMLLTARHRSLAPAAARVRGWRNCAVRARRPPAEALTVGVGEAWRRRYRRARPFRSSLPRTAG